MTKSATYYASRSSKQQSGFSIVELLIAVALGIVLSWAILDVTLNSSRTARELELTSEMVENGRYLTNLLSGELQLAGFYGRLESYIDDTVTAQPDPCTGLSAASLRNGMNYPVFGLDGVAAGTTTCNGDVLLTGSDALLIRRADTTSVNSTTGLDANQHYSAGDSNCCGAGCWCQQSRALICRKKITPQLPPFVSTTRIFTLSALTMCLTA